MSGDADSSKAAGPNARILLVTGLSGAGKTSVLKGLEDMGYEAIDNLPLSLLGNLVLPSQRPFSALQIERPLAVGIDIRTRDFDAAALQQRLAQLAAENEVETRLLYLDCSDAALERRYAETRHRHPLGKGLPLKESIAAERRALSDLRDRADLVLDTSEMTLGGLKRALQRHFALQRAVELGLFVTSFSYRRGIPRESDLVFDVRFLPEAPSDLPGETGQDAAIAEFIARNGGFVEFFDRLTGFLKPLLPRYAAEGKSYLTLSVGDDNGRRRAVAVAERLAAWLEDEGWRVHLQHRDLGGAAWPNRALDGEGMKAE